MSWKSKSFEALPALGVRGEHLRQSLRTVTVAWMFGVVWIASASGSHFRILLAALGFGDFAFGLLAALPFLATFGQLLSAVWIERTGVLKHQFVHCAGAHRLLWLAAAAIPLILPIPSTAAVAAMLFVLTASSFMGALSAPAWMTWMGALVPRRIRGRYFAARQRLALGVQIAAVVSLGLLMDAIYKSDAPASARMTVWPISVILAVGAAFGLMDILMFRRVPEVLPPPSCGAANERPGAAGAAREMVDRSRLLGILLDPLKDPALRSYVLYGATITFSLGATGWFFWRNAIENLGFSNFAANLLFLVVGPLAGLWAARRWGRAIDRWGRRPVLILCTAGASLSLMVWLLIPPGLPAAPWVAGLLSRVGGAFGRADWAPVGPATPLTAYFIAALACLLGGATWAGIHLAQTGIVLGFADGPGRSRYVAASSVLISTGGMLGGLVGGTVTAALSFLQQSPIRWGPFVWNNWHAAFGLALAARALTIFWLVRMPDPGAASVLSIARYIGANVYNGLTSRLLYTFRILGWQQAAAPGSRQSAAVGNSSHRGSRRAASALVQKRRPRPDLAGRKPKPARPAAGSGRGRPPLAVTPEAGNRR